MVEILKTKKRMVKMKKYLCRYTLRVDALLLQKLGYIAEYEGRSKNRELEWLIKKHIELFEKEQGPIKPEEQQKP